MMIFFEPGKKPSEIAPKAVMGGSGTAFGRPLGRSKASLGRWGAPLGRFWVPLGHFMDGQNVTFSKHRAKMCSKTPSEAIWGRFGVDFGGIWE